ncbi:MAG TPA: hypothetical protein VGF99_09695, partial [Myxococcota bacterium]
TNAQVYDTIGRLEPSYDFDDELPTLGDQLTQNFGAQFDNPLTDFDADAFAACLAEIDACDAAVFSEASACNAIFVGTRAIGEGCGSSGDCVPEAFCADSEATGCGVCTVRVDVDGACDDDDDDGCVAGAHCVEGSCVQDLAVGARCNPDDGAFCAAPAECAGEPGEAVCTVAVVAVVTAGDPCEDICGTQPFLFACVDNVCVDINVAQLGEPCDLSIENRVDHCVDSLFGNNTCADIDFDTLRGTCTARPTSGACLDAEFPCADDFVCNDDNECVAAPGAGEACDFSCVGGFYCDGDTATCVATKTAGAACFDDDECATGLSCDFDREVCVDDDELDAGPVCPA